VKVVVGLGANVGDRLAALREAARRVGALEGASVLARSRVYETAPVGGPPQGDFLNAAVLVEYTRTPRELLADLGGIERALGRDRSPDAVRWGPRPIDLDILWIDGGVTVEDPDLVVPHPRLRERAFALMPLLDVAPHAPYAPPPDATVRATALAI
jgi:2-amino-4-hydroxy-6-hydroxymethyldihydropteridine diphosphokinase